jgi:hypothetical protein
VYSVVGPLSCVCHDAVKDYGSVRENHPGAIGVASCQHARLSVAIDAVSSVLTRSQHGRNGLVGASNQNW